jgi:hypothetical protein
MIASNVPAPSDDALVEQLRDEELRNLRVQVDGGSREVALKNLDERGIAQELIRQQYSGRYPFELLQNANDALAEALGGIGGSARFTITDKALVVADMGRGFGERELRAICSLGRTSKDPRRTIGYKGLGFKSVEEITARPQVVSGPHGFMFDRDRARHLIAEVAGPLQPQQQIPVYAYPLPLTTADLGDDAMLVEAFLHKGFTTVVRLPFAPGVSREQVARDVLATLSPRILLFLQATDRLEVEGTERDFVATRVREPSGRASEVLLETGATTKHWLVFEHRVDIADPGLVQPLGDAWAKVEAVRVAVAVPLGADGKPTADEPCPLHVHFPTEETTGLPLILHGDFALDLDRRRVAISPEARPFNAWLSRELAEFAASTVAPELAARYPSEPSVVSVLAPRGPAHGFGEHIRADWLERLRTSRFIPALDGKPRIAAEAILRPALPDPASADRFLDLADLGNMVMAPVETDAQARAFLADGLGAETLKPEQMVGRLTPPTKAEAQPFYEWLVQWAEAFGQSRLAGLLKSAPCVLTTSGSWQTPGRRVFFPRAREDTGLPHDLPVDIADLPEVAGLQALLQAAGVRLFRWRELILDVVLPDLTSPTTHPADRQRSHAALRSYFEAESRGDLDILSRVGGVLVPAGRADGDGIAMRPVGATYLGSSWLGHDRLERIYGPFEEPEFIAEPPPADADERMRKRIYLERLGAGAHPRVEVTKAPYWRYMSGALYTHPHRSYGMWWDRWRATPEFLHAVDCGENHTNSQQLAVSYGLDRFPELVATRDTGRLEALFVELAGAWSSVYSEATNAVFRCLAQNHRGDRERRFPSLMTFMLRNAPWLSTTRGVATELTPARSTWRISSAISQYAHPFIPLLAEDLDRTPGAATVCEAIGVIDSARPQPSDVASILRAIAKRVGSSDGEPAPRWEDAARWAMRQLDGALVHGHDAAGLKGTPLLAARGGQLLFDPAPYVCEDRQLAAAWADELPIFQGDKDLTRLISALALPRLDQLVQITPVIAGPSTTDSVRLLAELHAASPYLAALAADAQSSRVDQIRSRLRFLQVRACRDLVLRYEFDGRQREQNDPTTFLTWRMVRDGAVQRRVGTAYLVVAREGGRPDWYAFGPQLAEYLEVPTQRDAFALILQSDRAARDAYVRSRGLQEQVIEERVQLELPEPPIDEWVPLPQPTADARSEQPAASAPSATAPSTREEPSPGAPPIASSAPPIASSAPHETETLPPLDPAGIRGVDVSPTLVSPPRPRGVMEG